MDPESLLAHAERLARQARNAGADEAEAYLWHTRDVEANVVGRIPSSRASSATGLGVRVVVGGALGHAACSSLEPGHVARAIEAAVEAAKAVPPAAPQEQLPDPQPGRGPAVGFDPGIAEATAAEVVRRATDVAAAMAAHPEVRFSSALLLHSTFAFAVASTRGVAQADRGTFAKLLAECRVRRGAEERAGNDYRVDRRAIELGGAGEEVVARARASLGAKAISTGQHDVLLDGATSPGLFQILSHALSGEMVADRRSFLAGKVGQAVAGPGLTVRDAPSLGQGRAAAVDDEGTPARDKVLIERGVLQGFLHDARSARRGKAASTGNAARTQEERHRAAPTVAPMCLAPEPGPKAFEDLVAECDRGVVVRHYLMGVANANAVTGDFSLVAPNAFWVERGEVRHALPPVTVAGNALRALGSLQALSRDALPSLQGLAPGVWLRGLACAT